MNTQPITRRALMAAALAGMAMMTPACSRSDADTLKPTLAPSSIAITYHWVEGSVPPPDHYRFTIDIDADGAGSIMLMPNYPRPDVPRWTETFTLDPAALAKLHAAVIDAGTFGRKWPMLHDPPVGGATQSMQIVGDGKTVMIPSHADGIERLEPVFKLIEQSVPESVWQTLHTKRAAYIAAREEN